MVDVAKGGSNGNENSHLSLYPGAKLTLSGAIAYIEPAGRALWNSKSLCLYNCLNSIQSVSYIDSVFGLTWSSWERTLRRREESSLGQDIWFTQRQADLPLPEWIFLGQEKIRDFSFPAVALVREIPSFNGIERRLRVPNGKVKAGHTIPWKAFWRKWRSKRPIKQVTHYSKHEVKRPPISGKSE